MERNLKKILQINKGFTLIELVIVVAILAILFATVAIAINAPQRLADTNDARRASDIRNILESVHEYVIDNKGNLPPGLTTTEQQLGNSVAGCVNLNRGCGVLQNSCLDLSGTLSGYLKPFPKDPKTGGNAKTNYSISIDSKNIVTVKACGTEGKDDLSVSM